MKAKRFSRLAEKTIAEFRRIPENDPPGMRRRETQEIGALIETIQIRHGIGRSTPEDAIRESWTELVGAANAAYSHAVRIDGKRLIVQATHAVVRNELFLHRAEILSRIRRLPGCAGVGDLRLIAG